MKIVFTVATYWPKTDGVQMVTQYHAEALAMKGHEVVVITSSNTDAASKESHNGVTIMRVDARNFYYWHRGDKNEYQKTVIKETRDADAIVAVCLQSFSADWLLNILNKIKCKKVLYMHGMPDFKIHLGNRKGIKNICKVLFRNFRWYIFYNANFHKIKQFNHVVHLFKNDNSHRFFVKKGFLNNTIIENSCEDVFFIDKISNVNGISKNFLYVGNYCERKNQVAALEAYYKSDVKDIGIMFIGSKNNKYCLKLQKVNEKLEFIHGKRNVKILYSISRKELLEYTQNAYACIMSSLNEFYPITIIESLAAGIPFISTNVGIVKYLPGGVIANKQQDMIFWMEFFARNPRYVQGLGLLGRQYAEENLSKSIANDKLEEILIN